eukprot:GHVH01004025.1.p1 GENE.GHVH01004025.1~~GHVH01004025.1.p1  ORF type:complete len:340 (+),score=27.59 GHVH01004025.1:99-1118(+)
MISWIRTIRYAESSVLDVDYSHDESVSYSQRSRSKSTNERLIPSIPRISSLLGTIISSMSDAFLLSRKSDSSDEREKHMDDIYHSVIKEKERMQRNFPAGANPLFYRKVGDGPDVFILLHGMVSTSSFWEESMLRVLSTSDRLRSTFIIPDLAGYGKSMVDPNRNYSVGEQVELLIRDVIVPEGIESFNLIGHSYGGLLALHLAGRVAHQILSLILLAPAYFSDPFAFKRFLFGGSASSIITWIGRLETSPYLLKFINMARPILSNVTSYIPESVLPHSVWNDLFETKAHTTIMTILGIEATGDLSSNKSILENLARFDVFITVVHGALVFFSYFISRR